MGTGVPIDISIDGDPVQQRLKEVSEHLIEEDDKVLYPSIGFGL